MTNIYLGGNWFYKNCKKYFIENVKMKYLKLFIFIIITVLYSCSVPKIKEKSNTTCYVYSHNYKFGMIENKGKLLEVNYYDDTLLIRKQFVNNARRKRDYRKYEYNTKGQRVLEMLFSRRDKLLNKTKIRYDERGRKFLEVTYNRIGQVIHKKEWLFDTTSDDWMQLSEFDSQGLFKQVKITEYDKYGRRFRGEIFGRNKQLIAKFEISKRDDQGNELIKTFYNPNSSDKENKIKAKIFREYDEKGRVVKEYYTKKHKKTYKYANNRLVEETFFDLEKENKIKKIRYVYVSE